MQLKVNLRYAACLAMTGQAAQVEVVAVVVAVARTEHPLI